MYNSNNSGSGTIDNRSKSAMTSSSNGPSVHSPIVCTTFVFRLCKDTTCTLYCDHSFMTWFVVSFFVVVGLCFVDQSLSDTRNVFLKSSGSNLVGRTSDDAGDILAGLCNAGTTSDITPHTMTLGINNNNKSNKNDDNNSGDFSDTSDETEGFVMPTPITPIISIRIIAITTVTTTPCSWQRLYQVHAMVQMVAIFMLIQMM